MEPVHSPWSGSTEEVWGWLVQFGVRFLVWTNGEMSLCTWG